VWEVGRGGSWLGRLGVGDRAAHGVHVVGHGWTRSVGWTLDPGYGPLIYHPR
jgi:hypothetical protein